MEIKSIFSVLNGPVLNLRDLIIVLFDQACFSEIKTGAKNRHECYHNELKTVSEKNEWKKETFYSLREAIIWEVKHKSGILI